MTWKLLIWFAFIGLEIARNYWLIEVKKKHPNYFFSGCLRVIGAVLYCPVIVPIHNFWQWFAIFIFQGTSFWLLFTIVLNKLRGLEPFHLGEHSGWSDPWFLKHPTEFRLGVFIAATLCILSIIVIYQR